MKSLAIAHKFVNSPLTKKLKHLIFGAAFAQILTMAAMPLLTRLYSSDEFGTYALFLSLVGVLTVFSTFRYERGIVVEKENTGRTSVFYLTLSIAMLSIPAMYILFSAWAHLSPFVDKPIDYVFVNFSFALALTIGLSGAESAFNYQALKMQRYGVLGMVQATRSASQALFQFIFVLFPFFYVENGLILGAVLAPLVAITLYVSKLEFEKLADLGRKREKINHILIAAKRNSLYPKYMVWSALCNSLTNHALVLVVGGLFSPSSAGMIFLAYRVLMIPAKIISKNVSLVNLQEASDLSGELITDLYRTRLKHFMLVGVIPLIVIIAVSPDAFAFVFGEEWRPAGHIAQILAPALYLQFVYTSFISIFTAVRAQRAYLGWSISRLVFVIVGLVIGAHLADLQGAVAGFSIALMLSYCFVHYLILRSLKLYSMRTLSNE